MNPLLRSRAGRVGRFATISAVWLLLGLATLSLRAGDPPAGSRPAKQPPSSVPAAAAKTPVEKNGAKSEWTSLFDGQTIKGWKSTEFGGEGAVEVKDGAIMLAVGSDLTGVNYDRPVPNTNYEVSLEAKRVDGSDFFCGLTFPVKKDPCSLIIGGWGGGVCGLSSIDGLDASENSTTKYREFDNGRWYTIRLRVTDARIEAWIDKEQIVESAARRQEDLDPHRS